MGPDQWANWSASVVLASASVTAAVVYHRRAPWRQTRIGRHIMAVTVAVGLLGAYTVLMSIWPTGPTAMVLRVGRTVLQVALGVAMIQRAFLITDAQRDRPDHPPDDDH
ncbi:hypothetical protein [Kitasatospora sp. NPDC005751]|uniref:putative phage holin n=1 Tax=Kitasatospora sp. NPDC005751 TaxID=3157064 RepID=UPI0033DE65CC